jgi:protein tyrosine kinase modulator
MEAEQSFEFTDYLRSLNRKRYLVVGVWLPIMLVSALLAVALPDVYSSSAAFSLKGDANDQAKGDNYADRYVSGLTASVLSSADLANAVDTLVPYPKLAHDRAAALKKLRGDVKVEMVTQKILDPQSGLERNINAGFTVSYDNRDPERAQKTAAWLADAFFTQSRRDAAAQAQDASKFYDAQADLQRQKIAASEARLAKFKQENFDRLPDVAQANLNVKTLSEQDLDGTERELRTLQQNRTFVLQQLQQAKATGANADQLRDLEQEYQKKLTTYDENYPDMIAMRRQIESLRRGDEVGAGASLEAQLAAQRSILTETRQRYSEDHPDVKRIERNIQSLQARIAAGEKVDASQVGRTPAVVQLETQLNGADTQIAGLERHRAEVREKLAGLEGRIQSTPEVERAYDTLNRDLGTARQEYDQLTNKRMDADVKSAAIMAGTADQFELTSAPGVPKAPSKPKRIGMVVIGAIGATMLALLTALAATVVDSTVRGTRDVITLLGSSPIGIVPEIRNADFHRRRRQRLTAVAAAVIVAVPALYLLIRFVVP